MSKRKFWILEMACLLILVVFISGCTTTTQNLNKTFNTGGISFNYPGNWSSGQSTDNNTIETGSDVRNLDHIVNSNEKISLYVDTASLTDTPEITIADLKEATLGDVQNSSENESFQMLSDNITTINGLKVYQFTYSYTDSETNQSEKSLFVITGKQGQSVYYLQIIADAETFDQNRDLFNQIISTIKVQ